jgi:hypothetical protein
VSSYVNKLEMEIQHENRRREGQSKREEFERIRSESIIFTFFSIGC